METLQKELSENQHCPNVQARLDKSKSELNSLIAEKTQAAAFRTKCKWTYEYETNSSYFFSLEKHRFNQKTMTVLKKENGQICNDQMKS